MVKFEKMSETAYAAYLPEAIKEYAQEKVKARTWAEVEAVDRSAAEYAQLLPDGIQTKQHYLFSIIDDAEHRSVGMIWFQVSESTHGRTAFIFDFKIEEGHQGKGYGRQAIEMLEQIARRMNIKKIKLHVFAHNARAIHLYETTGFITTDLHMTKTLN
ncbi:MULTISPECIES: N-acetyltransferase [Exiguobacterium]|uniref:GNAT family N-acetyltransferase n=1 Tax=Exiguobacterium TaxID=33986 RepID=UPI001AE2E679|nr:MULTISPECIES: GNAT family N-acetyltransferase [Exiguobacterium]MCT4780412.1 GNAT family N-acetyltransferase [Exiguobacterium soli]